MFVSVTMQKFNIFFFKKNQQHNHNHKKNEKEKKKNVIPIFSNNLRKIFFKIKFFTNFFVNKKYISECVRSNKKPSLFTFL